MTKQGMRFWVGCALGALFAGPASAAIDFEALGPSIYGAGESFSEDGYKMWGTEFGAIDTPAGCFIAVCPTGNDTQFYYGLNDGHLKLQRNDGGTFNLLGFDAGFIAPLPLGPDVAPGKIQVEAKNEHGITLSGSWDFAPSGDDGNFAFASYSGAAFGAFTRLTSVEFFACTFAADGQCLNVNDNLSQFGLDNIQVAVPEPSTVALMALGLVGLGLRARRAAR